MYCIESLMKELGIDFTELSKRYEQGILELRIHEFNEDTTSRLINYIRECNIFCLTCGNTKHFAFCDTKGCSENPNFENALLVPESVNYGAPQSLMGWLGYKAGKNTKSNERREILLKILGQKLWTPEGAKNSSYVKGYDLPNTPGRKWKMINHLGGINVSTTFAQVKDNRNQDIKWLTDLALPNDLKNTSTMSVKDIIGDTGMAKYADKFNIDIVNSTFFGNFNGKKEKIEVYMMAKSNLACTNCGEYDGENSIMLTNLGNITACNKCQKFTLERNNKGQGDIKNV